MKSKNAPKVYIKNKRLMNNDDTPKIPLKAIQRSIRLSGMSVNSDVFIIASVIIGLVLGVVGFIVYPMLAVALPISFFLIEYMTLSSKRNSRLTCVYTQLELFIKRCDSSKFIHIVDLIGNIYQEFEGTFRDDLESCYIEAQRTLNKDLALKHFKEKYDIEYLNFCIDTFQLIKGNNNSNVSVPTDFISKQTKMKVSLVNSTSSLFINTKADICITAICCFIVVTLMSVVFHFKVTTFMFSQIGLPLCVITVFIFLWGMFATYKE